MECCIAKCKEPVLHHGYMVQVHELIIKLNLCQKHFAMLNQDLGVEIVYGTEEPTP